MPTGLLRRAQEGDGLAMLELGDFYKSRNSPEKAIEWYGRSAEAGNAAGLLSIYLSLIMEGPSTHDPRGLAERAVPDRLRHKAETGDGSAMRVLGGFYWAIDQPEKATEWYLKSAEAGHPGALSELAVYLESAGRHEEAKRFYRLALDAGDFYAAHRMPLRAALRQSNRRPDDREPDPDSRYDRTILWAALGVVCLIASAILLLTSRVGSDTPTCDGKTMGPGDTCLVIGGGGDSFTYEEYMAEREAKKEKWADGPPPQAMLGYLLIGVGVISFGASFASYVRAKQQPS